MPFGVVSGVSRGMGVLVQSKCSKVKGRFGGFFIPVALNGIFLTVMYLNRA